MSLRRDASVTTLILLVVLSGCLGGGATPGESATNTDAATGAPAPSSTRTTGGPAAGTPTMGEIPTPTDRTGEVLEEIRRTQADIGSYRATEAYVIHLDGNPNGGTRAYYDAQTLWVDTDTGLVLRQTAQKPHLDSMPNVSMSDVRNPEENSPFNDSDDGPNPVYLGDKTITTTYTNVSLGVSDDVFDADIPPGADVENVTDESA